MYDVMKCECFHSSLINILYETHKFRHQTVLFIVGTYVPNVHCVNLSHSIYRFISI